MIEFLKNYYPHIIWFLWLLIPVIIYLVSNKTKKIAFTKIYTWKLINTDTKFINNKLSIKIWDKVIKDLSVFIFELKNVWKIVVDKTDFIDWKDLIIEFEWWDLLLANLKETLPEYLRDEVSFSVKENKLCIKPFIINTGDSLIFEVFYEWDNKKVIPKPRIKGIINFKNVSFTKQRLFFLFIAMIIANLQLFIKAVDKSLLSNETAVDIFFKQNVEIQNIYLRYSSYLLIFVMVYFLYRFVKVENTADRLRWRIRWENKVRTFLKNLFNQEK